MATTILLVYLIFIFSQTFVESLSGTASFTTYTSYASCCSNNPNYNSNAPTKYCDEYSAACKSSGYFSAIGHQSYEYVKSHNLISFYDSSDPNGKQFHNKYAGKTILLTKNGITITAVIAGTCVDSDCNGCCTIATNEYKYLIDMEYWTVINNFDSINDANGAIEFSIVDGTIKTCNGASEWWFVFDIISTQQTIKYAAIKGNTLNNQWVDCVNEKWGNNVWSCNNGHQFDLPISIKLVSNSGSISISNNRIDAYTDGIEHNINSFDLSSTNGMITHQVHKHYSYYIIAIFIILLFSLTVFHLYRYYRLKHSLYGHDKNQGYSQIIINSTDTETDENNN